MSLRAGLFKSRYFKFICSGISILSDAYMVFAFGRKVFPSCQYYKIILHFLLTSCGFFIFNFVIYLKLFLGTRFKRDTLLYFQLIISLTSPTDSKHHVFIQYILIHTWTCFLQVYFVPLVYPSILVSALYSQLLFIYNPFSYRTDCHQPSSLLIQHFPGHRHMFTLNFTIILSPNVPKQSHVGL